MCRQAVGSHHHVSRQSEMRNDQEAADNGDSIFKESDGQVISAGRFDHPRAEVILHGDDDQDCADRRTPSLQLNLHKARVRRNHGRLPSNGFIESAPEHRARAHFLPESAPPIKR